jgi:hypothetical protein
MSDLQELAGRWHEQRFPDAIVFEVTTKTGEELGELNAEVLIDHSGSMNLKPTPLTTHAPEEAADVVICLMALMHRWYPEYDLMDEVQRKMEMLTDPSGGHRASIALL